MVPAKVNSKIYQGSTFTQVLRLESPLKTYSLISDISKSAPLVITSEGHGMPTGWRFRVTNVLGMKEANSLAEAYYTASGTTEDTITVNAINAVGFSQYTSGGIIEYNTPLDLVSFIARMHIRLKLDDTTPVAVLTTENGGIIIDNVLRTVTITMSAIDTAALNFNTAVYSLELISSGGVVSSPIAGSLTLVKEVTR